MNAEDIGQLLFFLRATKIHESPDDLRGLSCLETVHGHAHVHTAFAHMRSFSPYGCNRCIAD